MQKLRATILVTFLLVTLGLPRSASAAYDRWTTSGPPGQSVVDLAIDPSAPDTHYALIRYGVYKTVNGGHQWAAINNGLQEPLNLTNIAMNPANPNELLVAGNRLYRTSDGGQQWQRRDNGLIGLIINRMVFDPSTPGTVYAATTDGLHRTTDDALTWNRIDSGLPDENFNTVALDPIQPSTLYVFGASAYRSDDSGSSWSMISSPAGLMEEALVDPSTATVLWAATLSGLFRSADSGQTWSLRRSGTAQSIAFDPLDADVVFAGFFDGVFSSSNDGFTWIDRSEGLVSQRAQDLALRPDTGAVLAATPAGTFVDEGDGFVERNEGMMGALLDTVLVDPSNRNILYAAGFGAGIFKSVDRGLNWTHQNPETGRFSALAETLELDPHDPSTLYAGMANGVFKSVDGGETWTAANIGLVASNTPSIAVNPVTPGILFAARRSTGAVFRSTDGAASWQQKSDGITGSINDVTYDPGDSDHLWVATSEGVFETQDQGEMWTEVTSYPETSASQIVVAPGEPARIYVSSFAGWYRSTDTGLTWELVNAQTSFALAVDPRNADLVYLSTTAGVLRSTDGGFTTELWNEGLGSAYVGGFAIDPHTPERIYAAVDLVGGGIYERNSILFEDGFESGNTSAWSLAVP